MIRFREVLFRKNFFFLWSSQIISEFGDRLNQMALVALIYSRHPGSVFAMAKLLFFIVIPVFLIGPLAGVYVDRWDRKKVMIISDLVRGVLVLTIPVLVYFDLMIPVYIAVFLIFSATRFFLPSKLALIPAIVSKEKLLVANSLSNTTRMIATIFGFALAGFIVKWIGHMWGFYLDSLSYFLSAVLIAVITPREELKNVKEDIQKTRDLIGKSIRRGVWSEVKEGFRYLVRENKMKAIIGTVFMLMAGTGSVFCVIIVFVQEAFGSATDVLGLLGVFLGAGLLAGTMLYGKLGQKLSKMRTMFGCLTLCGVFVSVFAIYVKKDPTFMIAGLLISAIGVAAAPIMTCSNTLVHLLIPDNIRGRIFSSLEAVIHLAFLFFMFLTAWLSGYFSKYMIILVCGMMFSVSGLVASIIYFREKME